MKKITNPSDTVLIDPNEPLILPDGTALVGRIEWFLYALCCLDYQNLPTPMSRIEEFANALITGEIPNIEPQSRAEQFFLAILDGNVSDLPQPQSRSEVLLDKLARGEFDLSDVEPIQSRYELLLAYLIKNGGIGNIDYVLYEFSEKMKTMYNTIEKPLKSLELSGNTLVNCVLEDTENDDYTSFDKDYSGTSFTINGTSEGAIKSAILKGCTLVNNLQEISLPNTYSDISNLDIELSFKINADEVWYVYINAQNVTSTRNYLGLLGDGSWQSEIVYYKDGLNKLKITSTSNEATHLRIAVGGGNTINSVVLMKEDVDFVNQFWGMQSVKMPVLTTVGKNLFDKTVFTRVDNKWIDENGSEMSQTTLGYSKNLYYIGMGTFTISGTIGNDIRLFFYDKQGVFKGRTPLFTNTLTFSCDEETYIRIGYRPTTLNVDNIQVEKGTQATTYEPYKSNILTVNEDVTLRGIGEVKDTLDGSTGELTQRIGEVVLDGASTPLYDSQVGGSEAPTYRVMTDMIVKESVGARCLVDTFPSNVGDEKGNGTEGVRIIGNRLYLYIYKTRLSNPSRSGVMEYLKSNPMKVQYPMSQEVIKTVALNVVDQNNTKIDKIHVFDETTHVNASSDELTPTVNISKSASYPTIIKPNTKYTVDLKRNDKPLTVNLGGTEVTFASGETRKVITTPNTLTNDKLSYYGVGAKCNEIMLIEGEVERNVDYFTGMQSVVMQNQMPILSTTGKNLADQLLPLNSHGGSVTTSKIENHTKVLSSLIKILPNQQIVISKSNYGKRFRCFFFDCYPVVGKTISIGGAYDDTATHIKVTSPSNAQYLFVVWCNDKNVDYPINCQVEYGKDVTSYEPHKTSILSCNDEIELNGIETYKDVLDCNNKKITRRTHKLLLNGSDDVQWYGYALKDEFPDVIGFYYTFPKEVGRYRNKYLYNGSLPPIERDVLPGNITSNEELIVVNNSEHIKLSIYRNKLKSLNVNGFKEWLSENPIEFTYVLKNPIVSEVELSVIDQDENVISKVKSYKDVTHLEAIVPQQSLLPNVSAEVATDNSKDMSLLTTKHQEISETQLTIQDSIQSQSDEIDKAMMATTEIFESILE